MNLLKDLKNSNKLENLIKITEVLIENNLIKKTSDDDEEYDDFCEHILLKSKGQENLAVDFILKYNPSFFLKNDNFDKLNNIYDNMKELVWLPIINYYNNDEIGTYLKSNNIRTFNNNSLLMENLENKKNINYFDWNEKHPMFLSLKDNKVLHKLLKKENNDNLYKEYQGKEVWLHLFSNFVKSTGFNDKKDKPHLSAFYNWAKENNDTHILEKIEDYYFQDLRFYNDIKIISILDNWKILKDKKGRSPLMVYLCESEGGTIDIKNLISFINKNDLTNEIDLNEKYNGIPLACYMLNQKFDMESIDFMLKNNMEIKLDNDDSFALYLSNIKKTLNKNEVRDIVKLLEKQSIEDILGNDKAAIKLDEKFMKTEISANNNRISTKIILSDYIISNKNLEFNNKYNILSNEILINAILEKSRYGFSDINDFVVNNNKRLIDIFNCLDSLKEKELSKSQIMLKLIKDKNEIIKLLRIEIEKFTIKKDLTTFKVNNNYEKSLKRL